MTKEDKIIIERFSNERTAKIAEDLNMTYSQICYRAYKYGLKKSKEFINSSKSGRYATGWQGGKNTQFKKGQIPHNKGKKMHPEVYEKVKNTMYKKGNKPHNTKNDNSISWREDKTGRCYAYYKIKDGVWDLLHRKIWIDNNGPIPKNNIIYFKDGDTKNLSIENLGMRTMEENMINNTYVYYPPEIKEVIRLNNKLKKKIYGKK